MPIIYYIHHIMSAPDVGTIVNSAQQSIYAIMTAAVSLGLVIVKWVASRDHSPRLTVLESDLDTAKKDIDDLQSQSGNISAAAQIATTLFPQLQKDVIAGQAKMTQLENQLNQATVTINELQKLIPPATAEPAKV